MLQPNRDSGFTLIEVLVAISVLTVMMAISVSGLSAWSKARAQSGTASELETMLRQTQQRAVTEGHAMCVDFEVGANQYVVYTGECNDVTRTRAVGPVSTSAEHVRLSSPSFTTEHGTSSGVTFYARGTASPGAVRVTRTGSSTIYTIRVEGLTGRVTSS